MVGPGRARHDLRRDRAARLARPVDDRERQRPSWRRYARANLWRDWGAEATTMFGIDQVPLLEDATRLEMAGGVTAKLSARLSLFAQAGYQFAVLQGSENTVRNGVKGDFGVRYAW